MSASLHELGESGESFERSLFERRARLPGGRVGVPSLEAVLKAARADSREKANGRRRAWGGLALAAACLFAVMKARPQDGAPAIVADTASEGAVTTYRGGGLCEMEDARPFSFAPASPKASVGPAASLPDHSACVATPRLSVASSDSLCCTFDDPGRSELR